MSKKPAGAAYHEPQTNQTPFERFKAAASASMASPSPPFPSFIKISQEVNGQNHASPGWAEARLADPDAHFAIVKAITGKEPTPEEKAEVLVRHQKLLAKRAAPKRSPLEDLDHVVQRSPRVTILSRISLTTE